MTAVSADDLVAQSDALLLHAPASETTRRFVNAALLARMKSNAVIVNTARGALIDEDALAQALMDGQIAGAFLDVFDEEPLPEASALRKAPNVLMSPHAAWYSTDAIGRLQALVAQDIASALDGRAIRCPVPGALARPAE